MATMQEMEAKINEMMGQIELLTTALTDAHQRLADKDEQKPKKFVWGGKFWALADRYVHGEYIRATPEVPKVVTFDKNVRIEVNEITGEPVDGTLKLYEKGKGAPVEKRTLPFAGKKGPRDRRSHERDAVDEGEAEPEGEGRPSDEDPGRG